MSRRKTFWAAGAIVSIALVGWGWTQRTALAVWYYARQIAAATPDKREAFVAKLLPYGAAGQTALVARLGSGNERTCAGCGWALTRLLAIQGPRDPRTAQVAAQLRDIYPALPPAGKVQVLTIFQELFGPTEEAPSDAVLHAAAGVLGATPAGDDEARPAALALAAAFAQHPGSDEGWPACRTLAAAGLGDARPTCRAQAVRLAAVPALAIADRIAPLLSGERREPSPEVRALALLALGSREDALPTDNLLPYLHDADREVRAVCEQALRTRGLSHDYLQLARMVADPEPAIRAAVPGRVLDMPDLDANVWLTRLSRDPSPAVRAATLRAAGEGHDSQTPSWLTTMAESDPSPTVKQLARYYLRENAKR